VLHARRVAGKLGWATAIAVLAAQFEVGEEKEQIIDGHGLIGDALARAVVDVGVRGTFLELGEEIEEVVDGDAAVGDVVMTSPVGPVGSGTEPP
jgi:hypothetical protein